MLGDADKGGEVAGGQAGVLPVVEQPQALFGCQRLLLCLLGLDETSPAASVTWPATPREPRNGGMQRRLVGVENGGICVAALLGLG